jgi:hypothetical protein
MNGQLRRNGVLPIQYPLKSFQDLFCRFRELFSRIQSPWTEFPFALPEKYLKIKMLKILISHSAICERIVALPQTRPFGEITRVNVSRENLVRVVIFGKQKELGFLFHIPSPPSLFT